MKTLLSVLVLLGVVFTMPVNSSAQSAAFYGFALEPTCFRLHLWVEEIQNIFTLHGYADCPDFPSDPTIPLTGTASIGPDGIDTGITAITSLVGVFHIYALVDPVTLNGTWKTDSGAQGTFRFLYVRP